MSPRPATFDHLRSTKKPLTKVVQIVLDAELADEHETAKETYDRAKIMVDARPQDQQVLDEWADAKAALEEVERRIEESEAVVTVKVKSIGRQRFDAMQDEFPPSKETRDKSKAEGSRAQVDIEKFGPALIAACAVEPELTLEEANELWTSEAWNLAECLAIYHACLEVNTQRRVVELGKGS